MKFVLLNERIIGEILAIPIYLISGMVYVGKGTVLNEKTIGRIKALGINTVYIEDKNDDINIQEIIDIPTRLKAIRALRAIFEDIAKKQFVNEVLVFNLVNEIIKNINTSENAFLFNNVSNMENDIWFCNHAIDVAVMSVLVGIHLKTDAKKLFNLGVGALLHDIGKLLNLKKDHATSGYELLKKNHAFQPTSYICVHQHHEKKDGTGFPLGLKGDNISDFSKIVAICDEYVNLMNTDQNLLPNEVLEIITARAATKFDSDIYKVFLECIYCYPNGMPVRLSDGSDGIVVMQNKNFPLRPYVGIYRNGSPMLLNLMDNLTLFIEKVNL